MQPNQVLHMGTDTVILALPLGEYHGTPIGSQRLRIW